MQDHSHIKQRLEAQLSDLIARSQQIEADLRTEHSASFSEWAAETEGDEVLEGLENASLREIAQIRAALRRIDEGSYGACATCGAEIAEARLAALPHATLCLDCADKA